MTDETKKIIQLHGRKILRRIQTTQEKLDDIIRIIQETTPVQRGTGLAQGPLQAEARQARMAQYKAWAGYGEVEEATEEAGPASNVVEMASWAQRKRPPGSTPTPAGPVGR